MYITDAEEGDKVVLTCKVHDVHHEVDFKRFRVMWIKISEQQEANNRRGTLDDKNNSSDGTKRTEQGKP